MALFSCLDYTVGKIIHYGEMNATSGKTERNYYINNCLHEDILIFGSSRALNHYSPMVFNDSLGLSAYNCGEDETGIILFYPRLSLIKRHYKPKLIVYDVYSPDFLNGLRFHNIDYLKTLKTTYGQSVSVDSMFWRYDLTGRYKMFSKLYQYNSTFLNVILDNIHKTHLFSNGFYLHNTHKMGIEPFVDNSSRKYVYDKEKLRLLELFIKENKGSIQLFFAISPEYGRTNGEMFEPIKALCDKYDVPLLDHYCDTMFTHHKEFFSNQNHLNQRGANLYSSIICSEIKKMENLCK